MFTKKYNVLPLSAKDVHFSESGSKCGSGCNSGIKSDSNTKLFEIREAENKRTSFMITVLTAVMSIYFLALYFYLNQFLPNPIPCNLYQ